jgi:chromosome segregation ATPase
MDPLANLDNTLETLRESVAALVKENQAINAENLNMRARVKGAQEDLRSLQAEARRLEEKKTAEMQRAQSRSGGVTGMKAQISQVDLALKQARDDVASEQALLNRLENEEIALRQRTEALSAEMAATGRSRASVEKIEKDLVSFEEEQVILQKKLSDVVNRVEKAKRQWQDAYTMASAGPQQVEALKAEYEALLKDLPGAEAELSKVSAQLAGAQAALDKLSEDYGQSRADDISGEVRDMAERNSQLEFQILEITKSKEEKIKGLEDKNAKARAEYMAKHQELLQRNVDLKAELDSLRKQMVDLDKKKAALEASIYPAP